MLTALAGDPRIRVVGINYKDQPDNAAKFPRPTSAIPMRAVGVDERGRAAIDWGVYGVPETFLVGPDGIILTKIIGAVTPQSVETVLKPAIAKALTPSQ